MASYYAGFSDWFGSQSSAQQVNTSAIGGSGGSVTTTAAWDGTSSSDWAGYLQSQTVQLQQPVRTRAWIPVWIEAADGTVLPAMVRADLIGDSSDSSLKMLNEIPKNFPPIPPGLKLGVTEEVTL